MWGVATIFTSGHSKGGGFDRTPRTPPSYGYGVWSNRWVWSNKRLLWTNSVWRFRIQPGRERTRGVLLLCPCKSNLMCECVCTPVNLCIINYTYFYYLYHLYLLFFFFISTYWYLGVQLGRGVIAQECQWKAMTGGSLTPPFSPPHWIPQNPTHPPPHNTPQQPPPPPPPPPLEFWVFNRIEHFWSIKTEPFSA